MVQTCFSALSAELLYSSHKDRDRSNLATVMISNLSGAHSHMPQGLRESIITVNRPCVENMHTLDHSLSDQLGVLPFDLVV